MPFDGVLAIPAYNEAQNLSRLLPPLEALRSSIDIVFVDDGSTDATAQVLAEKGFRVIRHSKNLGYSAAINTGLRHAVEKGYGVCVFMDADGQHDPRYVVEALRFLKETGADLVIGSRFLQGGRYRATLPRHIGMVIFRGLTHLLTGRRICDTTSGFKAFNRNAMNITVDRDFVYYHAEFLIYLLRSGCVIKEMPMVVKEKREFGRSIYNWKSSMIYLFKTLKAIPRAYTGQVKRRIP